MNPPEFTYQYIKDNPGCTRMEIAASMLESGLFSLSEVKQIGIIIRAGLKNKSLENRGTERKFALHFVPLVIRQARMDTFVEMLDEPWPSTDKFSALRSRPDVFDDGE